MNLSKLAYPVIAGLLMLLITPVFGDLAKTGDTAQNQSADCTVHPVFTDPEAMAAAMTNPAKFNELMVAINHPATTQALMNCSIDPKQWEAWMTSFSDPAKLTNAMAQFMNPQTYVNWMAAPMNPQSYQFMYAYMNPAFYMQWMTALMNPQYYQPMYKTMDFSQEGTAWMFNPSTYQNMFSAFYTPSVAEATVDKN